MNKHERGPSHFYKRGVVSLLFLIWGSVAWKEQVAKVEASRLEPFILFFKHGPPRAILVVCVRVLSFSGHKRGFAFCFVPLSPRLVSINHM